MTVDWNGAAVLAEIRRASVAAVDETTGACVDAVRAARSGSAGANISAEPAVDNAGRIRARWGLLEMAPTGDPFWELFVEVGNAHYAGDNAKRRAADQNYRDLAERIRRNRG